MKKNAEIKFTVELDQDNVPDKIYWQASDSDFDGDKECDSIFISIWDKQQRNSLSIDLWTKKMEIGEMDAHFYFTFMKMAETYFKSTKNREISEMIAHFAQDFAKKIEENSKINQRT